MSRIIKGGGIRILSIDFSRAKEDEEVFSPLQELLPAETFKEKEDKNTSEVQENLTNHLVENISKEEKQETKSLEEPDPENPPSSEKNENEEKEIDLLSIPEVAERLALLEQEAYEKGFAQGQRDGMELGRQQYESMAARLKELLKSIEKEIEQHVLSLEAPILSLVKLMAEKVIHREITLGKEVLKSCIRDALQYVVEQSRVRLHLNPEDVEYIDELTSELSKEFSRIREFEIVPDESISRGGCFLETDFGLVDATYERKWREILQKLEG